MAIIGMAVGAMTIIITTTIVVMNAAHASMITLSVSIAHGGIIRSIGHSIVNFLLLN